MKILLMETERHSADALTTALEHEGHHVARCNDPDWQAFPCVGVTDTCPVEGGIDVAVVVRTSGHPLPSGFETGATCAVRNQVPIVVAGDRAANPFAPWTVTSVGLEDPGAAVAAIEAAVSYPRA